MTETAKPNRGCLARIFSLVWKTGVVLAAFFLGIFIGFNIDVSMQIPQSSRVRTVAVTTVATVLAPQSAKSAGTPTATSEPTNTPTPTVTPKPAPTLAPGMYGVDALGFPYKLVAPEGLILKQWEASEMEKGGLNFVFSVSTPNKKFDGDLSVSVSYRNSDDKEVGGGGTMFLGSKSRQDRDGRTYSNDFTCEWGECPDILGKTSYYVIEFDVDLIDMP